MVVHQHEMHNMETGKDIKCNNSQIYRTIRTAIAAMKFLFTATDNA